MKNLLPFFTLFLFYEVIAQKDLTYQMPPQSIADLVMAPQTPGVSVNSGGDWMILVERPGYPSIKELAQPELRLAGIRINPRNNGSSRSYNYSGITFKSIAEGTEYQVEGLPKNPQIQNISWSPDGQRIAFTNDVSSGIELWVAELQTGQAKKLTDPVINDALGGLPYRWFDNGQSIVYKSILPDRGEAPQEPLAPEGPVIQQTTGDKAPVRTYQDLLEDPHDETLFEYYGTSQLYQLNLENGEAVAFAEPGIIDYLMPSPDDNYLYLSYIQRPFSYIVPYYRFAISARIYDRDGSLIKVVADIPPSENIPKGFDAVRTGPRNFTWRNDEPATLYWVEAQDGGDPNVEADVRDQLFFHKAPFNSEKSADIQFRLRYDGVTWGDDQLAIAYESWWNTRESITSSFQPGDAGSKKTIFQRYYEDRYNDPGNFQTTRNDFNEQVLLTDRSGNKLYLKGIGASPAGNRPFIREFNLKTKDTTQLWRSEAPFYEYPIKIIDIRKGQVITRRESKEEPPNYYLRNLKNDQLEALTDFEHPYPQLKKVEKQVVKYKREDGVDLTGDLYLPPGYNQSEGPLPVIMWAYPDEFKSADAASQVKGSPYEFLRLGWYSPLYFLTRGYAVFDDPSMPVVGEGDEEPNDTFRKQLVLNAKAAIDKLDQMGIADPERVAIGGHSYGAFMVANLLAHSDLFAAGIARSGAYNRTLTPFGFQAEERTYWETPEIYYNMSPFMHADQVNEPILMIHGAADNNSGTFPMQSERMFAAIKGLGGTARLVMLPHESHGYRAEQSIMHMLWEMDRFLEQYVKQKNHQSAQ